MANHVCPWWLGYVIASPLRRIWHEPHRILAPHIREGMKVLEPGPGMGYFTLELARLAGPQGRIVAVDIQPKMLDVLMKKAAKAGLAERILVRTPVGDRMGIDEFGGQVDFVLAFAMVHELPNMQSFLQECATAMKQGGTMLLAEPRGHVDMPAWEKTVQAACDAGLTKNNPVEIPRCHAIILSKERPA